MYKFVRTKDEIFDEVEENLVLASKPPKYKLSKKGKFKGYAICSECRLDSEIDKLCDEIVVLEPGELPTICTVLYNIYNDEERLRFIKFKLETNCTIYGAIWKDSGLIYEAKLKGIDEKGVVEWELIRED